MEPQQTPVTPPQETNEPSPASNEMQTLQNIENGVDTPANDSPTSFAMDDIPAAASLTAKNARSSKKSPLKGVLLTLFGVIVGAAAAIVVYKMYFEKPTTSTTTSQNSSVSSTTTTTTQSMSAEALVNAMKVKMESTEVPTTTDGALLMAQTKDGKFGAWQVAFAKPSGYDFYTVPESMFGFTVATNDENLSAKDINYVRTYLDGQGLTSTSALYDGANDIQGQSEFSNSTVKCIVSQTLFKYSQGSNQVQVGCADISSYAANAKIAQPLYKAYITANPDQKGPGTLFERASILDGKTTGYKRATVSYGDIFAPVGGGAALFYATPDGSWHFLAGTQEELACTQYTTSDAKKAYAGEACALANGDQSKVEP